MDRRNSGDGESGSTTGSDEGVSFSLAYSKATTTLQLPALSPAATLTRRRTSINTDKPTLQLAIPKADSTAAQDARARKHKSASFAQRREPKFDDIALMLARAEVANDLLFSDPKRVVIEHGNLHADQDTLQSLADVKSPTQAMAAVASEEPALSEAAEQRDETRGRGRPAADQYREYPEGDERALPEFILRSQTMAELDAETGAWEQALTELADGEFWRAVICDVDGLQARAPLHLAAKVRAGIPARVRGMVWQTLTRARSTYLQTVYTQLVQEYSPHERVIRRDLTRTFPKVPVFKSEGGEAQQRLFRILKAYSLYDAEVGYCQGLGFIIGPLIMNMGECAAFCVLVRLMETYDLRGMFTEDMAGLHLRLYQFRELAGETVPELMAHLEHLGVVPAMYVPSWFLSLFAYTMPLSFVLRAMDVIMAERAPETIIRIGIALLQRNADTLLRQDDFESAMGVLNSGLYSDDSTRDRPGFVLQEAARLGAVVTSARLAELEAQYCRDQGVVLRGRPSATSHVPPPTPSSQAAIVKFLGWPWSKDAAAARSRAAAQPPSRASSDGSGDGQLSPRVLELTPEQRERSRQLREQILQSLQSQDGVPPLAETSTAPASAPARAEAGGSARSVSSGSSGGSANSSSAALGDSSWREQVLEPLQQQLHDARVTSDTHRDALAALQADHELLGAELAVAKTGRAELAEANEQLRMQVRRLEGECSRVRQAEEALVRARMDLAEADEERALLERQLANLRRFIADSAPRDDGVVPRARLPSIDGASSPASPVLSPASKAAGRFSISSLASNWTALREAITSPRQPPPGADDLLSPRRSSVTVRSAESSGSDDRSSSGGGGTARHAAIPIAMLHRSKTLATVPTTAESAASDGA